MSEQKLKGARVAILATDGFEALELTVPEKALKAEGAVVELLSLHRGRIRGNNLHLPAGTARVCGLVKDADPARYDALLIPGGFISPDFLRADEDALRFVAAMHAAGKPIATLCHGPWVLASAGLLAGRQVTSWPHIKDDLKSAGAVWRDEALVRDGNLVTSRGPHDLRAFTRGMIELFAEHLPAREGCDAGGDQEGPSGHGRLWFFAAVVGATTYGIHKLLRS